MYRRMADWYDRPECDALRAAWGPYPATPAALQSWPGFVAVTNAFLDSDAADDRPAVATAAEPVAAEAEESEPVGASDVVPEVVEGEEGVVTEPVVASEAMEREAPAESGAEPSEATVGEGGGVLPPGAPGGPWAKSAVDPRVTEEKDGVMRLEAKLRAHDGSLKDASVKFKPGERFYNWDGSFKKKKKSPPPEELYTGPRDDGLLSTDEISGDYSAPGCPDWQDGCCRSMTVVPLGANTIEIGHSSCFCFPCGLCIGPWADGEVRTRDPGTNAFRYWRENEVPPSQRVMTFSADGTVKLGDGEDSTLFTKRPHSPKRTFQKVETKDLEGKWCLCCCCPFMPFWLLGGYCLRTTKKAVDEDGYNESGCGSHCFPICFPMVPNPHAGTRRRIYVNDHPTNGFQSGFASWGAGQNDPQYNFIIWYRDAGCGVAGCTCVKKLS